MELESNVVQSSVGEALQLLVSDLVWRTSHTSVSMPLPNRDSYTQILPLISLIPDAEVSLLLVVHPSGREQGLGFPLLIA